MITYQLKPHANKLPRQWRFYDVTYVDEVGRLWGKAWQHKRNAMKYANKQVKRGMTQVTVIHHV